MTKKKTMKNIKTPNKFEYGGIPTPESALELLNKLTASPTVKPGGLVKTWDPNFKPQTGISKFFGRQDVKNATGALGGVAGSLISNGFSTTGGQVLSGIGDAAMMFNPIIGGAIKLASGLVNRGFGTKWNQEGIAKAESQIEGLNSFQSGASDYDTLAQDFTRIGSMNKTIKASDLGEDGWFVNRTNNKANELNTDLSNAYNYAMRNANNVADNIAGSTLANLERNYAAFGGPLFAYGGQTHGSDFTNGLMFINNGGTHESNPYEGVPISMDQEGNPNLVEEGEVIWNDYVFSNRLKVPKSIQKKYKLGKREMTFANAVNKLSKESEERPNDPISIKSLENVLMNMAIEQETLKSKRQTKNTEKNKFNDGGDTNPVTPPENLPTWMRYAPVIGHGALTLTDALGLTNKPDYSNAEAIIKASNNLSSDPIKFKPIGDYLTYNPFDTEYHANQLRAVSGATRRNIMNTSGGNRAAAMAGILASDNNTMNQMGDLYRKAAEYNLEQRHKVVDFNRATNITNSEGFLKADMANQSMKQAGLEGLIRGYTMKEQANLTADQAKAANISGLFTSLGNIGYENANRNMMNWGMANGTWAPSQWKYDPITGKPVK